MSIHLTGEKTITFSGEKRGLVFFACDLPRGGGGKKRRRGHNLRPCSPSTFHWRRPRYIEQHLGESSRGVARCAKGGKRKKGKEGRNNMPLREDMCPYPFIHRGKREPPDSIRSFKGGEGGPRSCAGERLPITRLTHGRGGKGEEGKRGEGDSGGGKRKAFCSGHKSHSNSLTKRGLKQEKGTRNAPAACGEGGGGREKKKRGKGLGVFGRGPVVLVIRKKGSNLDKEDMKYGSFW